MPLVHANPNDIEALTTLRRSFHTLKGSGRMVNLGELGEVAWGGEQVLNLWLQEKRPASPALLAMLDLSVSTFGAWLAQLSAGGSGHYNAAELVAQTSALLSGSEPETASSPTSAPAPVTVPAPVVVASEDTLSITAAEKDARSMTELLADMESRDAAIEAEKVESELAAASSLIAVEISTNVEHHVVM